MSSKPPQEGDAAFEDDPHGIRALLRSLPGPGGMPVAVEQRIQAALRREAGSSGHQPDSDDAHDDIRRLLASTPAPGPMPETVFRRISSALEHEQQVRPPAPEQERISTLLRDLPAPGPMPAAVADRIEAELRREADARGERPSNVTPLTGRKPGASTEQGRTSRPASRSKRGWAMGLVAAAAAGVVAVGVGQQLSSTDPKPAVAGASSVDVSYPADVVDKVHVSRTGTQYTAASFAQQARTLATSTSDTGISADEASLLGPVATKDGALKCAGAVGEKLQDKPDKISVDIAEYEKKPSLIVVVTKQGDSTAWVLSRDCNTGTPPVAGPTDVS